MSDNEMLELVKQFVPFLGEVCGSGTEICVYDLSVPEQSLVAVCHPRAGHTPGSPLPQALREVADAGFSAPQDWVTLPPGQGYNADLCCRVCPIGDAAHPAGLLCITRDLSPARELNGALQAVLERFALEQPREAAPALSVPTLTSMMQQRVSDVIREYGIPPARMSVPEKVEVVHRLSESGVMNIKGAVSEIASQLSVSVPTVYRYLNRPAKP